LLPTEWLPGFIDDEFLLTMSRSLPGLRKRLLTPLREQLFDVQADPDEFQNLIDNPMQATQVSGLRRQLDEWLARQESGMNER
jgi:hypothetical protein